MDPNSLHGEYLGCDEAISYSIRDENGIQSIFYAVGFRKTNGAHRVGRSERVSQG